MLWQNYFAKAKTFCQKWQIIMLWQKYFAKAKKLCKSKKIMQKQKKYAKAKKLCQSKNVKVHRHRILTLHTHADLAFLPVAINIKKVAILKGF